MLERILLPAVSKKKSNEGTVLRWHIEEGASLRPGTSLLTIQMGDETVALSFRKRGKGLVLKEKAIAEGGHVTVNDTLALVGNADEQVPWSTEKEHVPVYGTSQYIRRIKVHRNIIGGMLLTMVVFIAFSYGLSAYRPMAGLALTLRTAVNQLTPIALSMYALLFCIVGTAYLCQIPPEMRRVLSFHQESGVKD